MSITALAPLFQVDDIVKDIYANGGLIAVVVFLIALGFFFNQRAVAQQITIDAKARKLSQQATTQRMDVIDRTYIDQLKQIRELHAKNDDLQTQVQRWIVDYAEQAGQLKSALESIEDMKRESAEDSARKNEDIALLKKQLDDLKTVMTETQEMADKNLENMTTLYQGEKARADGLAVTVTELSNRLTTANGRISTQESQIIKLTATSDEQQQTIDSQTGEIRTLGERVRYLERENTLLKGNNEQPLAVTKPIESEDDKGTP